MYSAKALEEEQGHDYPGHADMYARRINCRSFRRDIVRSSAPLIARLSCEGDVCMAGVEELSERKHCMIDPDWVMVYVLLAFVAGLLIGIRLTSPPSR